jgi:hypothetical protein
MTPDQLFSISNSVALLGWIILVFAGWKRWAAGFVTGLVLPLLFGVLYAKLVAVHFGETPGGFGTLSGVASLFSNRWMLVAGWIH